jgi:LytS/YehU family sensor histidine kinase
MLYESNKDSIPLTQEIKLIQDYIELEKIRYSDRLTIEFSIETDNDLNEIAPLILLPLIENAFKHGAGETRFDTFIKIDLKVKTARLLFTVENAKDPTGETAIIENIGLKNLRRQLELLYSRYNLDLQNGENVFKVELMIDLDSSIVL